MVPESTKTLKPYNPTTGEITVNEKLDRENAKYLDYEGKNFQGGKVMVRIFLGYETFS